MFDTVQPAPELLAAWLEQQSHKQRELEAEPAQLANRRVLADGRTMSAALDAAIKRSGLSLNEICRRLGLSNSRLRKYARADSKETASTP
jgi:hypothetical protein